MKPKKRHAIESMIADLLKETREIEAKERNMTFMKSDLISIGVTVKITPEGVYWSHSGF